MKYAIMSDVHSNPGALEMVLADARLRGCERLVLLGDVTGYGYDAKTALTKVREEFDVVLMGNHDSACVGLEPKWEVRTNPNYNIDVAQRKQLSTEEKDWLRERDYTYKVSDAIMAHGNFVQPKSWNYIFSYEEAVCNFNSCSEKLMFCGHTHHTSIWERTEKGVVRAKNEKRLLRPVLKPETITFTPKEGHRYIVNVGSVGYPRCDFCASYGIWDTTANKVMLRRLPFDFDQYILAMMEHNVQLPYWLAQLLVQYLKQKNL